MNTDANSESIVALMFTDRHWLRLCRLLLCELTGDEAILLSYLGNTYSMVQEKADKNGGWFYCKMKFIQLHLWFGRNKQTRILSNLEKKGFIKLRFRHGPPTKREVRIVTSRVSNCILKALAQNHKTESQMGLDRSGPQIQYLGNGNGDNNTKRIHNSLRSLSRNAPHVRETLDNQINLECTKLLKKTLLATPSLRRSYVSYPWKVTQAKEFKLLRKAIENDEEFLDIFEWYLKHLPKRTEYKLPLCTSPKQIRKQWVWIVAQYEKFRDREEPAVISKEVKEIVSRLKMRTWPMGSDSQLNAVVSSSLREYEEHKRKLRAFFENTRKDRDLRRLAEYTYQALPSSSTFIQGWFASVHDSIKSWKDWNGDLYARRFRVDHETFKHQCRTIAAKYCSKAKEWDRLMEVLDEGAEV